MKNNYIDHFIKIKGNKYSTEESERLFLGLLFYMLNDREIFKMNDDIKQFIEIVFGYHYKDYLYRARPHLASRLMNDIRKEISYGDLLILNNRIIEYLSGNTVSNKSSAKNENQNTNISGWLNMKKGKNR